jgi:hypothetical protein
MGALSRRMARTTSVSSFTRLTLPFAGDGGLAMNGGWQYQKDDGRQPENARRHDIFLVSITIIRIAMRRVD